ncbi:MAG: hypothetical protein LBF71_05975 [Campylobacteraceae bacterium]|jgi:hypothetical protein|nr:hypothetical protein [Campylobacteraceae bacterium]
MSKINIAILSVMAVLLLGCSQPSIPVKDEQTRGVYKIYYPNYFMYDTKMLNALLDTWCENDTCRQKYKNKTAKIIYVRMMGIDKCKTIDSTLKDDEAAEILRLEQQKVRNCSFIADALSNSWRYKPNTALVWFIRDKNGDFINSEFLTLQDGKVTDRKLIESAKVTMLYDKKGNKLLDRAHQNIYFYPKTCKKVLAVDGFEYEILPIDTKEEHVVFQNSKSVAVETEKLLKTKFYLDNKNSSKIQTFAPFGYMMEYGENFIGTGKHKNKIKVYRMFDKNGEEIFDGTDLARAVKINDSRFITHAVKPYTGELEAFLYDFDNKKVLLTADWIKPDYELGMTKYDKVVFFKDKKRGIADFDGNIVVDLQDRYDFENTYRGFIVYADGTGAYKKGVLDTKLNPVMKDLSKIDFRDDVFIAYAKDRVVVFDYSKNILQDLKADNITAHDDFYIASLKNEGALYDKQWNKLFDKSYKDLKLLDNSTFSYTFNGKTAVMDINAKEVIPPVCNSVKLNQCGIMECGMDKDNL